MSQTPSFAVHFAELVAILAHRPEAEAEQKATLHAAMDRLRPAGGSLSTGALNVTLLDVADSVDGVKLHELVMRMSAHSAHQIDFTATAPASEVLGVARILASEATANDDGAAFDARLVGLDASSVEVHLGRNGFVRSGSATPASTERVAVPPARTPTPFRGMPAYGTRTPTGAGAVRPATPAPPAPAVPPGGRASPARSGVPMTPPAGASSVGSGAAPASAGSGGPAIRDESTRIIERAIKSTDVATPPDESVIEELERAVTVHNAMRLLDQLLTLAEARAQEQRWETVVRVFDVIVRGEAAAEHDAELRRAHTIALRRLNKPTYVRAVASFLPRRPEQRDALHDILVRLGPDGAEALIDLLTSAESLTDRRAYLAALVKCRDAVPTLIHLLGDSRWYVVRNATDLLGEMRAVEAEAALIEAAAHTEERVRRSVATALARLGTPRSTQMAQQMLSDPVQEVRVHAAQALGATKGPRIVSVLSRALDGEHDPEVQAVILAALGRLATDEAVARLAKAAEPEGRIFRRKPVTLRISAVQALAEAHTPAAIAALRRLTEDKERDVRETAAKVLARQGRPSPREES